MEYPPHPSHIEVNELSSDSNTEVCWLQFWAVCKGSNSMVEKLKVVFGRPLLANGSSCTFPEEMKRLAGWAGHPPVSNAIGHFRKKTLEWFLGIC